jgi:hypothetical protein
VVAAFTVNDADAAPSRGLAPGIRAVVVDADRSAGTPAPADPPKGSEEPNRG